MNSLSLSGRMPCITLTYGQGIDSQTVNKYYGFFRSINNAVTVSAIVWGFYFFGFTGLELHLCDFISTLFLNAENIAL